MSPLIKGEKQQLIFFHDICITTLKRYTLPVCNVTGKKSLKTIEGVTCWRVEVKPTFIGDWSNFLTIIDQLSDRSGLVKYIVFFCCLWNPHQTVYQSTLNPCPNCLWILNFLNRNWNKFLVQSFLLWV